MSWGQVSLRRRLLALLLSVVSAVWVISGYVTYRDAQEEVAEVFDANLAQSARVLVALLGHEVEEETEVRRDVESVFGELGEEGRGRYPVLSSLLQRYLADADRGHLRLETGTGPRHRYEANLAIVSRHADGSVLLRTPGAPPFRGTADGFSDFDVGTGPWRVFSLTDHRTGIVVRVGERQAVRQELVGYITRNTLAPLLLALPVLALLIWLAVGQGLRPLRQVADEVERRAPDALDPVPSQGVPAEVGPVVKALNALLQRLGRALEHERRFTADAAHELRTPLAAVRTHAQVALRADPAGQRAALGRIVEGVDRATHLVEQLLTLARADVSRPGGMAWLKVDLTPLAAEVIAGLAPWALARGVEVALVPGVGHLRGDPQGLRVLLRNLVDNAVRYTPLGGQVTVAVEPRAGEVLLRVTDTGPGIPAGQRAAVLERFRRGEGGEATGSGLGLSIVQRIAELHGARLDLDDAPGSCGLQVRVRFPALVTPEDAGLSGRG